MEGWVKIGVQRASVLYPNSCYNELCYIEVQVYLSLLNARHIVVSIICFVFLLISIIFLKPVYPLYCQLVMIAGSHIIL